MNPIIVFDYSGTLIKEDVVEEAGKLRFKLLARIIPKDFYKMLATDEHYDLNKDAISRLTGFKKEFSVHYNANSKEDMVLSGNDALTQMMTNIFQLCMYTVANKRKLGIFEDGIVDVLVSLKKAGYRLAVASGIRTDIISGMLQITKCPVKFDYIYGQNPILSYSNEELLAKVKKHGTVRFVIGDKLTDIIAAKKHNLKSIFVKWGHPLGGEEKEADFTVSKPSEILAVIKQQSIK
jgi:phosphoglycolate phosphatase-like HAD superfamily hydrolase